MRVMVAGSSGLIGSALVPELRSAGHEVLRLVRGTPSEADERGWDPPAGAIGAGALDGVDAVVNLCGAGIGDRRWTAARKQILLDSRVTATEVLANAVAERGVGVLVNGSAVGYYGDTGSVVVTEDHPSGTGFLAQLCREWEQATAPASAAGARVVRLRTGLVLSPTGGLLSQLLPLFRLGLGGKLGDGTQYMPWISRTDVARALRYAVETETLSGPANITGPEPVTNAAFTKALGRALRRPTPWWVPSTALRLAVGEFADEGPLAGQRAVPEVLRDAGFDFAHRTLGEALDALLSR